MWYVCYMHIADIEPLELWDCGALHSVVAVQLPIIPRPQLPYKFGYLSRQPAPHQY